MGLHTQGGNIVSRYVGRITASSVCVVRDGEGHILMLKRRKEPYAGYWTLPGGKIEVGEDPADAATRELFEETGLEAEVVRFCGIASEVVDGNEGRMHFILFLFELKAREGVLNAGPEGDLAWKDERCLLSDELRVAHSDRWLMREMALQPQGPRYVALSSIVADQEDRLRVMRVLP